MEMLYHYLWLHRMMGLPLSLKDGRSVSIISPGVHNEDAGPDFSGAVIKVGDTLWAGNVEIHVKASDWMRHGHDRDALYDSVVLHVVAVDDVEVKRSDGSVIPQVSVTVPRDFYYTYSMLSATGKSVRCAARLRRLPHLLVEDWLETLAMERLQTKADRILGYMESFGGDMEQAMFVALARAMGFNLNSVPMEMLAKSLPLKYVWHHSDSPEQIEALLFGQAGMLDPMERPEDVGYQRLCSEYDFLRRKYGLTPIRRELWKYARTRPVNFPHRRIAMLGVALQSGFQLTSKLLTAAGDYTRLRELFDWELPETGGEYVRHMSTSAIESLMINVAVPFYFAYGHMTGDCEMAERGALLMERLAPEQNSVTAAWVAAGIEADTALRSQALLHLRKEYCDRSRCLQCRFGYHLLRRDAVNMERTFLSPDFPPPEMLDRGGILVAMDSMKCCLTSREAGEAVAAGLRESLGAGVAIEVAAVADGGEGMADAIGDARKLLRIGVKTFDPLMREIEAIYRLDPTIKTAFIDMAAASGLTLVGERERNPWHTTSYGTGVMINDALGRGCEKIVLGLGGTATNDAGLGILQALGAEVQLDGCIGSATAPVCGGDLGRVLSVDTGKVKERLSGIRVLLACDVRSPFTGPRGAVNVFAPQKGADARMCIMLERGMTHLRDIIKGMTGKDADMLAGAGAAGGAGGVLAILAGGEMHSGAEVVAHCLALRRRLKGRALLVTGEGHADAQTLEGKLPYALLQMASAAGVPTLLLAGRVGDREKLMASGFDDVIDINAGYAAGAGDEMNPTVAKERLAKSVAAAVGAGR